MTKKHSRKALFKGRTSGRLAAVQALFQLEQSGDTAAAVVLEFMTYRLKDGENELPKSDVSFFIDLVEGAWGIHVLSDEMIRETLKKGWSLERIEPVTKAILRAALYELSETQTPPAVIIDEYLNITRNFFDDAEVSFVNGVLNTIAQKIRPSAT